MNVAKDWGSSWHLIETSVNENVEGELNKKWGVPKKVDNLTCWKPTYCLLDASAGLKFKILHSAHTVSVCFVFISIKTATFAQCNINWSVIITEMKSVYCAVRTGALKQFILHV